MNFKFNVMLSQQGVVYHFSKVDLMPLAHREINANPWKYSLDASKNAIHASNIRKTPFSQ